MLYRSPTSRGQPLVIGITIEYTAVQFQSLYPFETYMQIPAVKDDHGVITRLLSAWPINTRCLILAVIAVRNCLCNLDYLQDTDVFMPIRSDEESNSRRNLHVKLALPIFHPAYALMTDKLNVSVALRKTGTAKWSASCCWILGSHHKKQVTIMIIN